MMKNQDSRSLSPDAQEAIRLRTVEAVRSGMKIKDASKLFGVHRGTISMWLKKYREGGKKSLRKKPQGRPRGGGRLEDRQESAIIDAITDHTPDQLKLPFMLWTREAVRDLIWQKFGVWVSLMTVGRWLKRWGFTPQKPAGRAYQQNPEAVDYWLKEQYPEIRRLAKKQGAEIHWGDEMGMRSDHQAGRSYGLKGQTPVIPCAGQRFSCNMISTVTNRGTLRFMLFKGRFSAGVFIKFLDRLIRSVNHKVFLVVDGHPAHKAAKVRKWAADHCDRIVIYYLPPYSPELNPDEFLNNDIKQNAVGRKRASNVVELMSNVRGYLRSTQKQPEIIKNYFKAKSVQYAMG